MPSIKRTGVKAVETKSGFEAYDGPEITRRGVYRAVVKSVQYMVARTGTDGLRFGVELVAADGDPKDHAVYDGYFLWARIWFGDKEAMIRREQNLYAALGVGDEPNIVYDEKDADLEPGGKGAKIKTIGGKNPVGRIVNLDVKITKNESGENRPEVDSILTCSDQAGAGKAKATSGPAVAEEDEDADLFVTETEEDEEGEEEDQTIEERRDELNGSSLADLKSLATGDYDLDVKGLKKAGIIEAILEHEYAGEDEGAAAVLDDSADEEDDEVEEDEVEDDEEEDEEEDDESAARLAELATFDRVALKAALRAADPDAIVKKSMSDDDIRNAVLAAEFPDNETPF